MSRLRVTQRANGSHSYRLADEMTGKTKLIPSVSAIVKTLHAFDNDSWKIGQVVDAILDLDMSRYAPTAMHQAFVDAGMKRLSEAPEFGRAVHYYCEQLWTGQAQDVPDQYAGHVMHVVEFWEKHRLEAVVAERAAFAEADDLKGGAYAGRIDLIVDHPKLGRGILDFKTWRANSKGDPHPEQWAMQLAAYADTDYLVIDDNDVRMQLMDWLGVLHIGPDSARFYVVTKTGWRKATAQVHAARHLKALAKPDMTEATNEW